MQFKDSSSTYVFTTTRVIREGHTIVFVSHDDNGDWQFLDAERNPSEKDAVLVSLEEMIQHDPSVLAIAELPPGGTATRIDKDSEWQIDIAT
jgi:hypothetical protein